ncbi:DUF6457 domain-containing protein [Nocardioides sp.]|uniref:DUF6457 domain-containing protein n=1 Tax=Nocardioides sp. TaxID=35761 RepID=UPI003518DE4A
MNLHDWIDEVCDVLDIETEADEGLLLDLAGVVHDNVHAAAGPVTAFLLGVATALRGASPDEVERLADRVQELAEAWDRPAAPAAEDDDPIADGGIDIDEPIDVSIDEDAFA